jgi:hypothetical protein
MHRTGSKAGGIGAHGPCRAGAMRGTHAGRRVEGPRTDRTERPMHDDGEKD